ncbi:transmembrane protein 268 [Echeneis naucrates]|uniref:Transmembrane protein 268 n=1 Tax=Echeneis naucrates TaxID=173247 RepID=A0A665VLA2_ECHNA|nr:transmembrane protein 268 [Echeneis naucrates]XP_029370689.1 transmembrane protein 268 [Echeneis naucrates]XP_029370690.1 transmembrane protein 268 [Echeneis naucrates]
MADKNGVHHIVESEVDVQVTQTTAQPHDTNNRPSWSNGQVVVSVRSSSALNPTFDLSLCRAKLENDGFRIPVADMEAPLETALDVPSVRRYMVFNSALFHFVMAPVLYVVLWCAVFSTLHLYITVSDYWVLCLSVSLISIFLTTTIIFILHHSNGEINMNSDVRLIQVNERMVKHKLLVAVADWVQNCAGNMQLYFVYWDMSPCLRALTETLEEVNDTQNKLKRKLSHLVLVSEFTPADPEVGGSDGEHDSDEQTPLLQHEDAGCPAASSRRGGAKVTTNYSLIPNASLPAQTRAYQLLMTYSAAYVKLLVSERLSGPSNHRLRSRRNHCTAAPLCLCQYIKKKILR